MNRITKRLALPVVAAAVLGTSGYAFMASNSVPDTFAGQGQGVINPANVTNVHYTIADHGSNYVDEEIRAVSFTVDKAAVSGQTIYAVVQDGSTNNHYYPGTTSNSGSWHKYAVCTQTAGDAASSSYNCAIGPNQYSSAKLVNATELYVIAAQ